MKTVNDIFYTEEKNADQVLDLYLPDSKSFSVFIYFHGGGLVKGDKTDAAPFAGFFTDRNIAVVSCNYRMLPDAHFPDFLEDAAGAVSWCFCHLGEYGTVTATYVGGSSAGGYISQMLCFDKKYLAAVGLSNRDITGYIHDAGQPTAHFNILKYRGIDSRRVIVDETAPLFYIGLEESYPPMLILVSDNDIQNRPEQTALLISTMRHFGCDLSTVTHKVLHGNHCHYLSVQNGDCEFVRLVLDFMKKTEG